MAQQNSRSIELTIRDNVVIARVLSAEITGMDETNHIFTQIRGAIQGQEHPRLLISLEGVKFVCSSVIANLCAAFREVVTKQEGKLAICCVGPELSETLRLMRLDMLLPIFDTEEDSMAAFAG